MSATSAEAFTEEVPRFATRNYYKYLKRSIKILTIHSLRGAQQTSKLQKASESQILFLYHGHDQEAVCTVILELQGQHRKCVQKNLEHGLATSSSLTNLDCLPDRTRNAFQHHLVIVAMLVTVAVLVPFL